MKRLLYILILLGLLTADNIYSQNKADLTVIGQWKLIEVKIVSGGTEEKRKEKEILLLNADGTYKLTNKRGELTGSWAKSDSTLRFVSNLLLSSKDRFSYQNVILKITQADLTLFSQDGDANFYSVYKRQK